ncbi:MAG TPA: hypothetical protein VK524_12915, partial [Polyangiaceae bacterium]|nr:hypothetical protein [Polyangiaceae bacterium]
MKILTLGLAVLLAGACEKPRATPSTADPAHIAVQGSAVLQAYSAGILKQYLETNERCRAELARVGNATALPGAPGLEKSRAELLARAKAEPVL